MRRLLGSLRTDALLQFRAGFYYVGALVAVFDVVILRQIPDSWPLDLPLLLPAALLINTMVTTFYFVAALVLLEKSEGTLAALFVTPLRAGEYLTAKVLSLTFLATAENAVIVLFFYGTDFEPLTLLAGILSLCAFYTLAGFVAISRYDSINQYMVPSVFFATVLLLPLLSHFGAVSPLVMLLHPVQPFLSLIAASFVPASPTALAYGVIAGAMWTALSFRWARGAFVELAAR